MLDVTMKRAPSVDFHRKALIDSLTLACNKTSDVAMFLYKNLAGPYTLDHSIL